MWRRAKGQAEKFPKELWYREDGRRKETRTAPAQSCTWSPNIENSNFFRRKNHLSQSHHEFQWFHPKHKSRSTNINQDLSPPLPLEEVTIYSHIAARVNTLKQLRSCHSFAQNPLRLLIIWINPTSLHDLKGSQSGPLLNPCSLYSNRMTLPPFLPWICKAWDFCRRSNRTRFSLPPETTKKKMGKTHETKIFQSLDRG